MQKTNNIVSGILIGMVLPALVWFVIADKISGVPYLSKPGVPYLMAIALNLVILRVCYKKGADLMGNGVILSTFVFMIAAFILKIRH